MTMAKGCKCGGKVASSMAWPMGMIGAPNTPCATRARMSVSRLVAMPHRNDDTVNPSTVKNIMLRQPMRLDTHPVKGVTTAVATRLRVITQEISSCVAENDPRICGRTKLATVIVMPNSMFDSCTIKRMSHCRPVMPIRPPAAATRVMESNTLALVGSPMANYRSTNTKNGWAWQARASLINSTLTSLSGRLG